MRKEQCSSCALNATSLGLPCMHARLFMTGSKQPSNGIQCVSVDSTSLIIYPEIKATEVAFSALKHYLSSFHFRIDNETGGIHRNTLYISQENKKRKEIPNNMHYMQHLMRYWNHFYFCMIIPLIFVLDLYFL